MANSGGGREFGHQQYSFLGGFVEASVGSLGVWARFPNKTYRS